MCPGTEVIREMNTASQTLWYVICLGYAGHLGTTTASDREQIAARGDITPQCCCRFSNRRMHGFCAADVHLQGARTSSLKPHLYGCLEYIGIPPPLLAYARGRTSASTMASSLPARIKRQSPVDSMLTPTTFLSSVLHDAPPSRSADITSKVEKGFVFNQSISIYAKFSCKPQVSASTKLFFVDTADPP